MPINGIEPKTHNLLIICGKIGGAEEDRTPDLRIANATLSQLSYGPTDGKGLKGL
jgi:hypothetical protein